MMRNVELLADACRIHQPLGAAGALAAHQPEGEPLHLPSGLHQECSGQGAVDPARETNRDAVLTRPEAQACEGLLPCIGGRS